MDHTATNAELTSLTWPEDIPKRLGPILCSWIAVDWIWLTMGTFFVTLSFATPPLNFFEGFEFGTLMILFSVAWATISFFAYKRRLWAIRWGFYLSLVGFAPFFMMPVSSLYQIAVDGELLVLGSTVILVVATIIVQMGGGNPVSRSGWLAYYAGWTAILTTLWRYNVSEHSHDIQSTFPAVVLLSFSAHILAPYVTTCRALYRGTKELGPG